MSQSDFIPLTKWKPRFICAIHGPTSWPTCIQCSAELALRAKLAKQRESLKSKHERMASTLTNSEGSG